MDKSTSDAIQKHIQAISDGFEKRAASNIAIGHSLKDLTLARIGAAGSSDEAHSALDGFVEAMLHW